MLLLLFLLLLNNNCLLPLILLTVIYSFIIPSKFIPKIKASQKLNYISNLLTFYLLINIFNSISKNVISKDLLSQSIYNNGHIILVHARLTSEEKDLLLKLHQKTRKDVGASNMQPLEWSSTLASEAQEYADECRGMVHSGVMGENLASATYNDVERLYHLWENERESFEKKDSYRQKFPGGSFGHYSQIVWASNTKVGCGYSNCENSSQPYYLVCRYEIGNILGYEVYSYSSSSVEKPNVVSKKTSTKHETHTTYNKHTTTHTVTKTSTSKPTSNSNKNNDNNSRNDDNSSKNNDNSSRNDDNSNTTNNTSITNIDLDTNNNYEDNNSILIENNDSQINYDNIGYNNIEDNGSTNDDNNNYLDASIGNGVNVVAEDDGNGGLIFVVLSGTAVSGAFALFYVKKKKPEQYQKLLHQVSVQQKQIGKITKKLTIKVSRSTSSFGKMIERSRTTTALSGHQIRKPSIFKRSKSTNDKYSRVTDNLDLEYKFNLNKYDDLNTNNRIYDNWNYNNNSNTKNDTVKYGVFPINQKSYRKLSDHRKENISYAKNIVPVPNRKMDMIEKMNNDLNKYESFISNDFNDRFSKRKGGIYNNDYKHCFEKKSSDCSIENGCYSSSNKNDTYNNAYEKHYDCPPSMVVINPDLRPPIPVRCKSNTDKSREIIN